ncbi:hypothetical protein Tery_1944 [Trichodesmium erythraeum IMS101]|uniref:Uncharacterized protein n=2 Tax=Trichodesmium erythraeum TaxID=1206 RepID=Q113X6_TRIEI|nr:hypothetical protein [Trichodesmium erythraeum GBRTRLIN201]
MRRNLPTIMGNSGSQGDATLTSLMAGKLLQVFFRMELLAKFTSVELREKTPKYEIILLAQRKTLCCSKSEMMLRNSVSQ